MSHAPKKPSTTKRTLQRYWSVTKTQWPMFVLGILSAMGFVFFLTFGNPYFIGKVVDKVTAGPVAPGKIWHEFGWLILALIATNVLGQISSKLQDYSIWRLEISASYQLSNIVFNTLSNQSMTFHSNRFGGSLVSQTTKFLSGYETLGESFIFAMVPISSSALFTILFLVRSVPYYVLCLVILLIIYVFATFRLFKRILPLNAEASAAHNVRSGELSDSITNILAVKTHGKEDFERALFRDASERVVEAESKRMRSSIQRGATSSSIIVLIMCVLIIFVTGGSTWFGIKPGVLVMMFTYTYWLSMQINRLAQVFTQVNRALGDARDMTIILDEPLLVADRPDAPELEVREGQVCFDNITFRYNDAQVEDTIFDDFTLCIPPGQRVGLVGRSGSGKTTLTKLLLRLVDIQGGTVRIDGQNVAEVTQSSLRRQIAYVPQEPLLFHRTIRENIAYGRPEASMDEIITAAREANALEFIEKLPQGFETITGERGVKLSGGQRQRIAIARAILTNAPLLVLDEATSALDSESERLIQDALNNLMRGKTAIVIAHRLSTVASLDRIVVLSEGRIVEDGKHAQLIEQDGEYAHLWNRQTGAFLEDEEK